MRSWLLLLVILVVAAALRFYNLSGYLQFLGDQGRDALIVKAMIVEHKWTLLGPSASVGGFFTGPIYYYMVLPFLWAWRLNPVGPAYFSAFIGIGTIVLIYWFGKTLFNIRVGLIAAFLAALSPKMIDISRFSWNPNPVPFFTLLTLLLLYKASAKKKLLLTFFAGMCYGILYQLHYMTMSLGAVLAIGMLLMFSPREWFKHFFAAGLGFVLGNSLFIIFEIRHGFPNTKSVLEFVTRGGKTVAPRSINLFWLSWDILRRLYGMTLGLKETVWESIFLLGSVAAVISWSIRSGNKIKVALILSWIVIGALGVGFYRGQLHDHYFGYLYPVSFLLLGVAGHYLLKRWWTWPVFVTGVVCLTYFMVKNLYLWQQPNNMLAQIQDIDKTVLAYADGQPYNLGLISSFNTDKAYRYYLEVWGRPAVTIENPILDPNRETVTQSLIVICEDKKCEPLGHPTWEIAGFGRAEIADSTMGPAGIRIFKLVHYQGK